MKDFVRGSKNPAELNCERLKPLTYSHKVSICYQSGKVTVICRNNTLPYWCRNKTLFERSYLLVRKALLLYVAFIASFSQLFVMWAIRASKSSFSVKTVLDVYLTWDKFCLKRRTFRTKTHFRAKSAARAPSLGGLVPVFHCTLYTLSLYPAQRFTVLYFEACR